MLRAIFISFFALILTACGGGDSSVNAAPAISVENASLRLPAPGQTTGAAYFEIVNKGGADVLLSAATSYSNRVELHTHLHEDGIMKMRQVDSVDIGPKTVTHFKTGGLHIMIFNMDIPAGAAHLPLTLTFEKSGMIEVEIMISEMGGMNGQNMGDKDGEDSHKGH